MGSKTAPPTGTKSASSACRSRQAQARAGRSLASYRRARGVERANEMTKSWVSGGKSTEVTEKLRQEVSDLEAKRDALVEKNKRRVFEWSSFVFNSGKAPASLDALLNHALSAEVKDVLLEYRLSRSKDNGEAGPAQRKAGRAGQVRFLGVATIRRACRIAETSPIRSSGCLVDRARRWMETFSTGSSLSPLEVVVILACFTFRDPLWGPPPRPATAGLGCALPSLRPLAERLHLIFGARTTLVVDDQLAKSLFDGRWSTRTR